ncbi:hypothetical protein [Mycolicibacterium sp.]|uniref:hypothetical protein n=1 Tax=Mycolicibacterium sp. TaxID=2320850 RepID=UPI00355DB9CD
MAKADRLQFCQGDNDITSEFHREDDATEVRVWDDEDGVLVAVHETSSGTWEYAASDYGADPDWNIDQKFRSWQEALTAFGYGELT